jgi:hypothetical protein
VTAAQGPVVATGTITSSGETVSGAPVILFASTEDKLLPLSRAESADDGTFTLRLDLGQLPSEAVPQPGILNVQAVGFTATGVAPSAFTIRLSSPASATIPAQAQPTTRQLDPTALADPANVPLKVLAGSATKALAQPDGPIPPVCTTTNVGSPYVGWAIVGATFSDATDIDKQFSYTNGASTQLGVGVSTNGSTGWSASGTYTVTTSTTGGSTFSPAHGAGNNYWETEFVNQKKHYQCYGLISDMSYYYTQPVGWAGGARSPGAPAVGAGYCVGYQAGSTFWTTNSKANKWGVGWDMTGFIGINLSTETDYSSSSQISYHMNAHGHPVCGTNTYPGNGAVFIGVHGGVWP